MPHPLSDWGSWAHTQSSDPGYSIIRTDAVVGGGDDDEDEDGDVQLVWLVGWSFVVESAVEWKELDTLRTSSVKRYSTSTWPYLRYLNVTSS